MSTNTSGVATQVASITVWGHASIFYWWPLWAYGFICAAITAVAGRDIDIGGFSVRIFDQSWLGLSFLLLMLFIIMFSALKVKPLVVVVVVLGTGLAAEVLIRTGNWDVLMSGLLKPVVFMNLAFYLIFSSVLFVTWILAVFVIDRFTYWRFQPGQLQEVHRLDHIEDKMYPTLLMSVRRRPVDFLRKALGLFHTADIVVNPENDKYAIVIPNVWNVDAKLEEIMRVINRKS